MYNKYVSDNITIEKLKYGKYSYIRLNDGDIRIASGYRCGTSYQYVDSILKEKLKDMINELNENNYKNLVICINKHQNKKKWYLNYFINNITQNELNNTVMMNNHLKKYLEGKNIIYFSSYIDNLILEDIEYQDIDYKKILYNKEPNNLEVIKLKSLFQKDIKNIDQNIEKIMLYIKSINSSEFSGYKSNFGFNVYYDFKKLLSSIKLLKLKSKIIKYFKSVKCKSYKLVNMQYRDNFEQYKYLLNIAKDYCKDNNILIFGCGPTGKVIIYELKKLGYENICLDFGQKI